MIHEVTTNKIKLAVDGTNLPVTATLRYDTDDPYAVQVTFHTCADAVEWIFSRDLLHAGITKLVGEGDVKVWPCVNPESMWLALSSPEGEALLELDVDMVKSFLGYTFNICKQGTESVNMDDVITKILAEG